MTDPLPAHPTRRPKAPPMFRTTRSRLALIASLALLGVYVMAVLSGGWRDGSLSFLLAVGVTAIWVGGVVWATNGEDR